MSERISRIDFVKQKYRLNELCFIDAERNGKKLGHGKVMADETFEQFVDSDPSGTCKYLDWMLFMAGGGQTMMEKSLRLWEGEGESDQNALRNQCHRDFVAEQIGGYTDDQGVRHPPVLQAEAERNWRECEERCRFEFLMGDQDIALEDGYGFYRYWPGKDGLYDRVASAIQFWHNSQQKLSQQNQQVKRAEALRKLSPSQWTESDRSFMTDWSSHPLEYIEMDIYKGWKPREFSQAGAVYKNIEALLAPLSNIRKALILKDERIDQIYEDSIVRVICPLTVGASIKHGVIKWCVANRTDFDKSFEPNGGSNQHWKTYTEKGPLVYMLFKVPMPPYCHKLAVHLPKESLGSCTASTVTGASWYDAKNEQAGFSRSQLFGRIEAEHKQPEVWHPKADDDKGLAFGDRPAVRAWSDPAQGHRVLYSINKAAEEIAGWARKFDQRRIVCDYLADSRSVVKLNE